MENNNNKIELDSIGRRKKPLHNDAVILLRLPIALHQQLKIYASVEGTTISKMARNLFTKFLNKRKV